MKHHSKSASLGIIASIFAVLLLSWPVQTTAASSDTPNKESLNRTIHDYILNNPEVLVEALRSARAKEQERSAAEAKNVIKAFEPDLVADRAAPVLGNPKGDVSIVEFFDYRCPYCRQVEGFLQQLIKSDANVRVVQKEMPVLGPASVYAARVALAAEKQGKHAEFHSGMTAKRPNLEPKAIDEVAKEAGLDMDRLKSDLNDPQINAEITHTLEIAKALDLKGTPAFIIGDVIIPGATDLETLQSVVAEARKTSTN